MASKSVKVANVCPVCLETRPLKIAGRCKHSFCSECLTITLGTQKGEVFPCPTCKQDCPRPWDGVKGMVDFTGEDVAAADILVDPLGKKGSKDGKKELERTGTDKANVSLMPNERRGHGNAKKTTQDKVVGIPMDVKCTVCHHKKNEVQAVNLCVECGNLYICEECTKVHARNKATQGHVVVRFRSEAKQQEAMCQKHDTVLSSYCHECEEEVCVMLDHGDHHVEKLADVVDVWIQTLKHLLGEREREFRELQGLKCELTVLEGETAGLDKQDILIKEIEDHAQRCIDHVVKWKEALKEQVKTDFSIVRDILADLKKVSDLIEKLQGPIGSAAKLLSQMDNRQITLKELISKQKDLEATSDFGGDINRSGHLYRLGQLHHNDYSFIPNEIDASFGRVDSTESLPVYNPEGFPQEVFRNLVQASDCHDGDSFIPCVANLGKKFAVAQPTIRGQPAEAIDIYEFPGKLKHTLTDNVLPLYDMSSTPEGKLAVLSRGIGCTSCTIKLFDPDTGYISCTRDIDILQPLSIGVTQRHQYVILGGYHLGQKVITVVDKEGNLECSLAIDVDLEGQYSNYDLEDPPFSFVDPPHRTTCGGGHIFVMSSSEYAMYAIDDGEIQLQATFDYRPGYYLTDISADLWGDHILCFMDANEVVLEKWVTNQGNVLEDWRPDNDDMDVEAGFFMRVSARDGHIVLSRGRTIQVFKE